MSDIRFNQWLHQSGTGGVSQSDGGHVGIGTTNPLIPVGAGNTHILNVGVVTCNNIAAGSSITAGTFYGSGANLTSLPAQVTIANNADNRVITGGSGVNLNGEANLTFSGSTLKVNNTSGHSYLKLNSNDSYSGSIYFGDQSDEDAAQIWYDNYQGNGMYLRTSENTPISFYTNNTARLRLTNGGDLTFLNSNANATAGLNSIIFSNNSGEVSRIRGESRNGNTNGMLTFFTDISGSSAERMRVNHDGAFCFGNDSARPAEFSQPDGFSIRWDDKGQFQTSVTNTTCGLLNRKGTDGDILSFRKAGTGVGHIGVNASTMYFNFNASSVAANQLDDYEEGSWTPLLHGYWSGGWRQITIGSGTVEGATYTKVGRLVYFKCYFNGITMSGNGPNTYARIYGLPFQSANNGYGSGTMITHSTAFENTNTGSFYVSPNASDMIGTRYGEDDTGYARWSQSSFYMMLSGVYEAA